jgi:hypothetical protein
MHPYPSFGSGGKRRQVGRRPDATIGRARDGKHPSVPCAKNVSSSRVRGRSIAVGAVNNMWQVLRGSEPPIATRAICHPSADLDVNLAPIGIAIQDGTRDVTRFGAGSHGPTLAVRTGRHGASVCLHFCDALSALVSQIPTCDPHAHLEHPTALSWESVPSRGPMFRDRGVGVRGDQAAPPRIPGVVRPDNRLDLLLEEGVVDQLEELGCGHWCLLPLG